MQSQTSQQTMGRTTSAQSNVIFGRTAQPIVQRTSGHEGAPRIIFILILGFVLYILTQKLENFDVAKPDFSSWFKSEPRFKVEQVQIFPRNGVSQTTWQVSGFVMSNESETVPAPDLEVRLLREDGTLAARTVAHLNNQPIEPLGGLSFSVKLTTSLGETLGADVRPILDTRKVNNE